ncbi:hypothetical protein [Pedobacter sp.]
MTAIENHYQKEAFRQAEFEAFLAQDLRDAEQWASHRKEIEAEYRDEARREQAEIEREFNDSVERNWSY